MRQDGARFLWHALSERSEACRRKQRVPSRADPEEQNDSGGDHRSVKKGRFRLYHPATAPFCSVFDLEQYGVVAQMRSSCLCQCLVGSEAELKVLAKSRLLI